MDPKQAASQAISRAIAAGQLIRPSVCPHCRRPVKVTAVPLDLDRPLAAIDWVCHRCAFDRRIQRRGTVPCRVKRCGLPSQFGRCAFHRRPVG